MMTSACWASGAAEIGGQWPPLNLRTLHRIVFFAIENQFSLVKQPPLLLVASSTSVGHVTVDGFPIPRCDQYHLMNVYQTRRQYLSIYFLHDIFTKHCALNLKDF